MNYSSGSVFSSVFLLVPRARSVDRRAPATRGPDWSTVPDDWTEVFAGAAATTGSGTGAGVTGCFFLGGVGCHGEKKGKEREKM
jgi:hypothetical protein